jgi:hypothetical protein
MKYIVNGLDCMGNLYSGHITDSRDAERDAIRAATIEECAKVAEGYGGGVGGMSAELAAEAIRALLSTADTKGK